MKHKTIQLSDEFLIDVKDDIKDCESSDILEII